MLSLNSSPSISPTVAFYVVRRFEQDLIAQKSCRKQIKTPKILRFTVFLWWRLLDSNQWPPACEWVPPPCGSTHSGEPLKTQDFSSCAVASKIASASTTTLTCYYYTLSGRQRQSFETLLEHLLTSFSILKQGQSSSTQNATSFIKKKWKRICFSLRGIQQYWIPLLL